MITGTLQDLRKVISGRPLREQDAPAGFRGLGIDSRTLALGNLFMAIRGEKEDGHKYIRQAEAAGAGAFIIESGHEDQMPAHLANRTLVVPDTKKSLREIARWWRKKFNPRIVAITGTNGKTTTKEMVADLCARKYRIFRSPGNFNNLFGIPLALCLLDDSYEVCVLELGMSYPGEIETLTQLVEPQIALITNIGPAHLETMGSIERIAQAKFELLNNIASTATRILNLDDPILAKRYQAEVAPKLSFAVYASAEVRPSCFSPNSMGRFLFEYEKQEIHLRVPGLHNLYNALAACAVARVLDLSTADMKAALGNFQSINSRMHIFELGGITVIDDSYNANPTSMRYALKVLQDMQGSGRRIAVLGDMKELGAEEMKWHQEVGRLAAELNPDMLIAVGQLGREIADAANRNGYDLSRIHICLTAAEAAEILLSNLQRTDRILIKASRAMKLDLVVEALRRHYGGQV